MKSPRRVIVSLAFALVILAPARIHAWELPVPLICQEQSCWCWAACTEAMLKYFDTAPSVAQCDIADYARQRHGWGGGTCAPCCVDPSHVTCCNRDNCMYDALGCIDDLLLHWSVPSTGSPGALDIPETREEIKNCRPFIIN